MPTNMVYVVGLGLLACIVAVSIDEARTGLFSRRFRLGSKAFDEYMTANRLFVEWRAERPFLWVRQCAYATSLVERMIGEYERYIHCRGASPQRVANLESLRRLLDEIPPHHDPPQAPRGPVSLSLTVVTELSCLED